MAYTVQNGIWRSVFAVPCDVVDLHLKLCGEVQLKVLLAILRYNGGLDTAALSSIVGRPEPVILEALEYLADKGLVGNQAMASKPELEYMEIPEPAQKQEPLAPQERKISTVGSGRRRLERDEIAAMSAENEEIAGILQEAQQVLGDTLRAAATETIVALYSYYNMRPDLIMMVLQYCKSIGRLNMPYIEKVAASWVEKDITTHEQAEREIMRLTQLHTDEGRIKTAFGIHDRALAAYEKKYIPVWFDDYGFDIHMISLAYERAVAAKGKLSFSYINGILTNWHAKGVKNPAEALRDIKENQPKKQSAPPAKSTSYNLEEIEQLLNSGNL